MKKTFLILLTIFALTSCNQGKMSDENKTVDSVATKTIDTITKELTANMTFDCSEFKFKNVKQQADTLMKYFDKKQLVSDKKFFCAFPNSFKEMQDIFGFEDNKGAAPLYDYPSGENMIKYFANLNTISKEIYYDKYINICVDGVWKADNIREAFGFADRLTNDTKAACSSLSKRTDNEIKSVFHFIFDGPHPNNDLNKETYNRLLPKVTKQNERLGKLLTDSYRKVMSEDDGHGR